MSPRAAAEFTKKWPALKRRLESLLRSKGVAAGEVDDLVQETATRLLSFWPKLDRSKSLWPLAATIALNLLRDRSRRRDAELLGELPDVPASFDVAQIGLARMELASVLRAMDELTPSQRAALLQTIAPREQPAPSTSSEKMLRMRARKRLANAVGRASAGIALKFRRSNDVVHALFSKTDVVQALACATCLFVTTAGAASLYPQADEEYSSGGAPNTTVAMNTETDNAVYIAAAIVPASNELLDPRRSQAEAAGGSRDRTRRLETSRHESPDESESATSSPGSVALTGGTVPTNAPIPAPAPPDAPTSPSEAPNVVEAPAPDDQSPVQAPSGDAPLQVFEETTEVLRDVTE